MKLNKRLITIFVIVIVLAGAGTFFLLHKKAPIQWRTTAITRGDVEVDVTATGTLNAFKTVSVGTQVSGTVSKLFADFNTHVKKGQVIALLDPALLHAAVDDARATLLKAQSQEKIFKLALDRDQALLTKGLIAQADLDQGVADYDGAKAGLSSAQSGLNRAIINLGYATIVSPIDGVVIGRQVDVGQTVAASFNTPTLFTIADDLSRMQVQASIDEADIGQVHVGQVSQFSVDAYPDQKFKGTVSQIRLQPTTSQNVVNYTVMVDVDNPEMHLLPGMTANITIPVQKVTSVLKVPSAALKFTPPFAMGGKHQGNGGRHQRDSSSTAASGSGQPGQGGGWSGHHHQAGADSSSAASSQVNGRVFILDKDKIHFVPVQVGLAASGFTQVTGNLTEGQLVVVGIMNQGTGAPGAGPGAAPNPMMGMPRRF